MVCRVVNVSVSIPVLTNVCALRLEGLHNLDL